MFWLSLVSFGWTLRWFWDLLKPRQYEYPADDAEVWKYAEEITHYHSSLGLKGIKLEQEAVLELKTLVAKQFGDAARTNLTNNAAKLKARSQLLLFILIGFVLVIAAEGITYVSELTTDQRGSIANVEHSQ